MSVGTLVNAISILRHLADADEPREGERHRPVVEPEPEFLL